MTIEAQPLSSSILEKLAAASTPEEVKAVLTASRELVLKEMSARPMSHDEPGAKDETPDQAYYRLQKEFAYLDGISITRQDAATKYGLGVSTVQDWENQGLVSVIQAAKRRGLPTWVNEKDVAVMAAMNKKFRTGKSGPIKGWRPPVRNKSEENE